MTYRRPAITVIQEFTGLVADITALALPSVAVGPAYQLVDNDLLGTYSGNSQDYSYASKAASAQIDLSVSTSNELYPDTKKDLAVSITEALVRVANLSALSIGAGTALSDSTIGRFAGALKGDLIEIKPILNVLILAAVSNGSSVSTSPALEKRLIGVSGQFADVKAGDKVTTTAGTNTVVGVFTVIAKSGDTLILDTAINTGGGASSNIAYSISGDRGVVNAGSYKIKTITDANNIVLESPLAQDENLFSYIIKRPVTSIAIVNGGSNGFTAIDSKVSLPSTLTYNAMEILAGNVKGTYRALRTDLAANVKEYTSLDDVKAVFGVDQITPQNPLAYSLYIMKQNTTTPVNALALDGNAVSDEGLSYANALDVLGETEMYAIAPLTQSPAIHQQFNGHVTSLSSPDQAKERVAIINKRIVTEAVMKEESTTSTDSPNSRIIINTQVDGAALIASPTHLNDATVDAFLNVSKGDTIVVSGGTNAVLGEVVVTSKTDNNNLIVSGNVVTANSSDLEYYVIRKDGIGADGITFYDRNAAFITDGIAVGYTFRVMSGSHAADYLVNAVISEKLISIAQVPGVTSLVTAVDYEVIRTLAKNEQADFISTYSASFGNRRMVNVWPDTVQSLVGSVVKPLPGFYACAAVAAATTGLPSHQGFTGLELSGFLGFEHSTGYFKSDYLNIIADGGTFILEQAGAETPLFVRHQLTTDRTAIKYQEYSVTKNVDFICKTIRTKFAPFLKGYNIYDGLFEELKTTAKAVVTFFKEETIKPKLGGVIKSGALTKIMESATQIDTVLMRFKFDIPIPLNHLEITVEV